MHPSGLSNMKKSIVRDGITNHVVIQKLESIYPSLGGYNSDQEQEPTGIPQGKKSGAEAGGIFDRGLAATQWVKKKTADVKQCGNRLAHVFITGFPR